MRYSYAVVFNCNTYNIVSLIYIYINCASRIFRKCVFKRVRNQLINHQSARYCYIYINVYILDICANLNVISKR
ncbi:membrane protein [Candidatus Magnetoovum chiemensis]|nr:membrane protein [Candidatus Magnetoovum chiemensis]